MNIRNIVVSKHADVRAKQRGVPPMVVDLILDFGKRIDRGDTCTIVLDKKALKQAKRYGGSECLALLNRFSDIYLIVSEDHNTVVTVGHRCKNQKFRNDNYRRSNKYLAAA